MFSILSWYVIHFPDYPIEQNILITFQTLHSPFLTDFAKLLAVLGGLPMMLVLVGGLMGYVYLKKIF